MNYQRTHEREKTPWRVICPHHGPVCLTREEYTAQMMRPGSRWECPAWDDGDPKDPNDVGPGICGAEASWDDHWYEMWTGDE